MTKRILSGDPPVELLLRRSRRARRISLRVSRLDGRVTLTLPHNIPEREALAFAEEKAGWLRDNLASRPDMVQVGLGERVPVLGDLHDVVSGPGRLVRHAGGRLIVPGDSHRAPARIAGYLKTLARDRLTEASDRYAQRLGLGYSRVTLRDTRSRWGSCSPRGALMYSWRLVMAPPEVLDYVAAHEVAHLRAMNHSPAFWACVDALYGDYRVPRRWLRQNGETLHAYRFGD